MIQKLIIAAMLAISMQAVYASEPENVDTLSNRLQEIVVVAKQPATKLVGSTLVSTIAGSSLQNLGTAIDVLAQLPMLTVADGEVSVVGRGTPEIFIDGRPVQSSDELLQLASDNMKKVELEMAPGAAYASDTRAVLKITTRRNFIKGLSILERAEVQMRRKWSVNDLLDVNYRAGDWDMFASATAALNNSLIEGATVNTLVYQGKETEIGSTQKNSYPSAVGTVKAGFNYLRGKQSFGAYYRFNPERAEYSNEGSEWLDDNPAIVREIERSVRSRGHLASVYYDNTFAEKYLLHFDGNYRKSDSGNDVSTIYPEGEAEDVRSSDKRKSELWAAKLYLSFPLKNGSITIGTQNTFTHTTLDYKMLNASVGEYIPSSLTDARQISAAAFASWDKSFGKLNLSAGLRYEYVDYLFKVNGVADQDVSRKHNMLTPDISVGYMFSERSQLNLSYKMATVKPPYSQLSGSLNYVGMHEIEGGNTALRDEHMHNLSFFGMWNDFIMQADYARSLDSYAFVKRVVPASSLRLLLQPVNIDVTSLNLYAVWSRKIRAWLPSLTIGMYRQWLELSCRKYERPIFSYYFENMISLPGEIALTLNASGSTKGDMHTNRFGATWFTLDASVGKSFFDKALQVKLSATDIFNTANNDWTIDAFGVRVEKQQRYDNRGLSLTLTYRFQPRQSKYKGKMASEAEMKRL